MAAETDTPAPERDTESKMSDEQIQIIALTFSNVSQALRRVPADLAHRIREQQEDVADKRREAQVNEDLLRLRVR